MTYDTGPMREILAKATPGRWQQAGTRHTGDLKIGKDARLVAIGPDGDALAMVFYDMKTGRGHNDAALIVAAKNDMPAMLDTIDAQAAELARLREAAQAVIDRWHLPTWRDVQPTAEAMDALAAALKETSNG